MDRVEGQQEALLQIAMEGGPMWARVKKAPIRQNRGLHCGGALGALLKDAPLVWDEHRAA